MVQAKLKENDVNVCLFVWLVLENGISAISSISYRRLLFHVHACLCVCWNKMVRAHWALLRTFQKMITNANFWTYSIYNVLLICQVSKKNIIKILEKAGQPDIWTQLWKVRHVSVFASQLVILCRIFLWQVTVSSIYSTDSSLKISWIVIWNM